jgi:ABC-type dipeptide/oligopeptide/nickel transport system ATPase component
VADVNFEIGPEETLGLIGESGCGKSVTALSVIRLVRPPGRIVSGTVEFEGRDLMPLGAEAMRRVRGRRIGFVFQEPAAALSPVFTIGSQIAEVLAVHGLARGAAARRRAVELLESVRIGEPSRRAGQYPHQLSGGLRQRAMIALAIAADPVLLIADEPTTALDPSVQIRILELLEQLKRSHRLSILLVSHDAGVVARLADRVAVMAAGRIVETGSADAIFRTPQTEQARRLLAGTAADVAAGKA